MDLSSTRQSLDSLDFHFQDENLLDKTEKGYAESSFNGNATKQTRRCMYPTYSQSTIVGLLAVVVIFSLLLFFRQADHYHHASDLHAGDEFGSCGTNRSTAIANGCIFDNLSYCWVRPACHHPSLLKSFQDRHEIKYYYSPTRSPENRIPIEEIMNGKHTSAYADQEQHPIHCAFMLAKLHEAFINGGPIDNLVKMQKHTRHCTEILLDSWLHEIPTCEREGGCISKVNMQFTSCGYV